jgi:hypothetical protein
MSKRQSVYDYYIKPREQRNVTQIDRASASAVLASPYYFKGEQTAYTVVVRADLNGYSKWAKEKKIEDRVALLDEYFTHVISLMPHTKAVYFRDEGDCIVALFSSYFNDALWPDVKKFCEGIVSKKYGADKLTAKCCLADGEVAYYQKVHEKLTNDWSAEGEPFVTAHRLESTVDSEPRIYYPDSMFQENIKPNISWAPVGQSAPWTYNIANYQVPGLGNQGGWSKYSYLECNTFH